MEQLADMLGLQHEPLSGSSRQHGHNLHPMSGQTRDGKHLSAETFTDQSIGLHPPGHRGSNTSKGNALSPGTPQNQLSSTKPVNRKSQPTAPEAIQTSKQYQKKSLQNLLVKLTEVQSSPVKQGGQQHQ